MPKVETAFDIAVIGGGPGGYVAALRAAQLGARTAIVERDRLGGTCLVRGCIPTKALLQSSELYQQVRNGEPLGLLVKDAKLDYAVAARRKDDIVAQLVKGVEGLLKAGGVETLRGTARLVGGGRFEVAGRTLSARDILIATGSVPSRPPIPGVEHTIDSDGILELTAAPARLVVIGGGVVGMEWGALFAALGSQVTVIEMLPRILPMAEADLVQVYRRHFEGLGGTVHTQARVEAVSAGRKGRTVTYTMDGDSRRLEADVVLLATGRVPFTEGLGTEAAGVQLERGRVVVDDHLRTSAPGVWAIGDVIGGIMLAHVASYEGVCAVENIAGGGDRVPDYHAAPNCIYTDPEIAHVGLGEGDARDRGLEVQVGRFPFAASGRAMTLGQTEGFIKVVTDSRRGTILGVHMVGPRVTDLISEATLAVQQRLRVQDLDLTMHAHPTLAESLHEAALAAEGRAIHVTNRRRRAAPVATAAAAASRPSEPSSTAPLDRPGPEPAESSPTGGDDARPKPARPVQTTPAERPEPEPPAVQVAVEPGKLTLKKQHRDELLKLYRAMYLVRRFEERTQEQYTKARIGGFCHLNIGEEATVVGGITPLQPQDYIFTSYREHGHALARGLDPKAVMAELFGKETGVSRGRGGSMHMFDLAHRFMGGYGIVGGHLPLATGVAFAIKYAKADEVVFCMFGDGASNIGAFHESLNFAKVFKLPVIWFCVNNQYGMGTAVERASAVTEMVKKAASYDMEAVRVDGMNVLEVLKVTADVVERTRKDHEPRLIEAVTYRFRGHSVADPDKYRTTEEKDSWKRRDPLLFFQTDLTEARIAREADLDAIRAEVDAEIDEVVRYAEESPNPDLRDLFKHVYAGEWDERR